MPTEILQIPTRKLPAIITQILDLIVHDSPGIQCKQQKKNAKEN